MDSDLNLNIEEHDMIFGEEEELAVFEEDINQEPFTPIVEEKTHDTPDIEMTIEPEPVKGNSNEIPVAVNVKQKGKPCLQIIVSNLNMPPSDWNVKDLGIEWRTLHLPSIFDTTKEILRIIRDTIVPKKIIVSIYQRYAGGLAREVIEGELRTIFEENRKIGVHQLQVPTMYFVPEHCNVWPEIGELNVFIRRETLRDNMGPFNLHRFLMKPLGSGYTLYCKGPMWEEYRTKVGLGRTLSSEGLAKIRKFTIEQFKTGFCSINRPASRQGVREVIPPPLHVTPGWRTDDYMLDILISRGLAPEHCRERPASVNEIAMNQLSRRGRTPAVRLVTRHDPMIVRVRASVAHRLNMEADPAAQAAYSGASSTSSSRTVSRASTDEGISLRPEDRERNYNMMTLEREIDNLTDDVSRLRVDRDYWRNRCERKEDESREWRDKAEDYEKEVYDLDRDIEEKNRIIEDLENDLEASRYDNRELDDHVERLKADKDYLNDGFKQVKAELDRISEQYDALVSLYEGGKKKSHKKKLI